VIRAASSSAGENTARVSGEVTGEAITMAFNAKYLLDALNTLHADHVSLECSGPDRPGIFRPVGDSDYLALVMPLRLDA
jgi:DNA polymerase-3 subunit beta